MRQVKRDGPVGQALYAVVLAVLLAALAAGVLTR